MVFTKFACTPEQTFHCFMSTKMYILLSNIADMKTTEEIDLQMLNLSTVHIILLRLWTSCLLFVFLLLAYSTLNFRLTKKMYTMSFYAMDCHMLWSLIGQFKSALVQIRKWCA